MMASVRVERVLELAHTEGLIPEAEKDAKMSVRVHRRLIDAAKKRSGLTSDSALVEYALAKVAIEDDFGQLLSDLRGSVSRDIELEF
jgi:hypothetical protein